LPDGVALSCGGFGRCTSRSQYAIAWLMSVPPPSWVPKSTSTGSCSSGVRSTTLVSNTTMLVLSERSDASTAANTLEYTTEEAIEPLWSMHRTTSRWTACCRRP